MIENNVTSKKMTAGIIILIILSIALCITTFALVYSTISVENNIFKTGSIQINLNDGKPVIEEHEFQFEPGMTVEKEFFIENQSTWSVYYKIYFDNVAGDLADVLEITISDGDKVLYQGTASHLNKNSVSAADDELGLDERRTLTVSFHFPEGAGNVAQNQILAFDLCAEAVQTKNNPNREFD